MLYVSFVCRALSAEQGLPYSFPVLTHGPFCLLSEVGPTERSGCFWGQAHALLITVLVCS